jgi:hypothetical protein
VISRDNNQTANAGSLEIPYLELNEHGRADGQETLGNGIREGWEAPVASGGEDDGCIR